VTGGAARNRVYRGLVRKALLLLLAIAIALFVVGWIWLVHRPSEVERAVRSAAEAGAFPIGGGYMYNGEVECRVEEVGAVHGQDLYLCKLGLEGLDEVPGGQYIYAAIVDGRLYTHRSNPILIPEQVFDPNF
jgi:hypothetical protein